MLRIISAPSNLGLRPPEPGSVPGTAKAPDALREAGLYRRLVASGARDGGVVLAGRYRDDLDPQRSRLRNQEAIVDHARRLSERVGACIDCNEKVLILGGDCSLLVGIGLALSQRGRFGLIHLDGHTDFRHPGNSHECGSLGGEDLAAVVGRHWDSVADIDGQRPYFRPEDAAHLGSRRDDEHLEEVGDALAFVMPAEAIRSSGPPRVAAQVLEALPLDLLDGYWIHLDVDILDPSIIPAVDSPADDGLLAEDLLALLAPLVPGAVGVDITIYDPDLDPEGTYARLLTELVTEAMSPFAHNDRARQSKGFER